MSETLLFCESELSNLFLSSVLFPKNAKCGASAFNIRKGKYHADMLLLVRRLA